MLLTVLILAKDTTHLIVPTAVDRDIAALVGLPISEDFALQVTRVRQRACDELHAYILRQGFLEPESCIVDVFGTKPAVLNGPGSRSTGFVVSLSLPIVFANLCSFKIIFKNQGSLLAWCVLRRGESNSSRPTNDEEGEPESDKDPYRMFDIW